MGSSQSFLSFLLCLTGFHSLADSGANLWDYISCLHWFDFMEIHYLVVAFALTSLASPAFAGYGAIAYSQNSRAHGQSWNYPTRWEAEQRAINECSTRGYGCKAVMWFRSACGALAVSGRGGYGAGWDTSKYVAEQKAMAECYRHNNSCYIELSHCTN